MKTLLESQFKELAELPEGYSAIPKEHYNSTLTILDKEGKEVGWMNVCLYGFDWVQDWVNSDKELLKKYPTWGYNLENLDNF